MNLAYTIWTWGLKNKGDFETALRDIKEAGYDYFENFDGLADMYFDCNDEFQKTLTKYDVKLVNVYDYIKDINDNHIPRAQKLLEFLKRNGAHHMNIQAPGRPEHGPVSKDLTGFCRILNEVGKLAREYDIWLCMHPHFETTVEQEQEIEYVADRINPEYVGFCFDTAHLTLAGMDCVSMFEKYANLVKYVHLKDANADADVVELRKMWRDKKNWEKGFKVFYELGEAGVDFQGVVNVLKKAGYEGYLTVELDHTRYTHKQSAVMSRNYLKEKIKL